MKVAAPGKGTQARPPRGTGAAFVCGQNKSRILYLELMPGTFLNESGLSNGSACRGPRCARR